MIIKPWPSGAGIMPVKGLCKTRKTIPLTNKRLSLPIRVDFRVYADVRYLNILHYFMRNIMYAKTIYVAIAISCMLLMGISAGYSQSLPIDFETDITTDDFVDFDGGVATVIANPQSGGINTSTNVAQIVRNGGAIFAGSKIDLAAPLDFSVLNGISMKVYTSAPVGTTVKFKLEGTGTTERDVVTTVSDEWEVLTWDFTGEPTNFNSIVFMFDFGNVGDSSATSTFLFDDIEQLFGGTQIDLPVTFEDSMVNYTVTDFDGPTSELVVDPTDATNMVIQTIKTSQSGASSGTTIGTPAGFATDIPLSLTDSKMTVRVWSPEAGTPVRLKVEDSGDPTHTCETQTNTTLTAEWETVTFDFINQAPGTESLMVGLSMGWTYNMASIFFNFGTDGATAGEKTYYFDDVSFGPTPLSNAAPTIEDLRVFPNPTTDQWQILTEQSRMTLIEVYDIQGHLLRQLRPDAFTEKVDASAFAAGMYICKISTRTATSTVRLLKY